MPPPADITHLIEDRPTIVAGILAFDCWIGNTDRSADNLAYVRDDRERPVTVFDHSHALLGTQQGQGADLLRQQIDQPFVAGNLASQITSSKGLSDWSSRISEVSAGLIRDLCQAVADQEGITADECAAAAEFLTHRKDQVLEHIKASKGDMPNVKEWELDQG